MRLERPEGRLVKVRTANVEEKEDDLTSGARGRGGGGGGSGKKKGACKKGPGPHVVRQGHGPRVGARCTIASTDA